MARRKIKVGNNKEFITLVGSRGQITIPKELRDKLGIKEGSIVKLKIIKVIEE